MILAIAATIATFAAAASVYDLQRYAERRCQRIHAND